MEKGQQWTLPKIVTGIPAAAALVIASQAVHAQEAQQEAKQEDTAASTPAAPAAADTTDVEEIVVVGYRQSLNAALEEKRDAVGSIDAIVAEDIADFPDLNLAESIQRVPGVSIDRNAGEGRRLTVRGLGAQFTRVRINGMEALTTTGSEDAAGGANRDRQFDFNVFASELFNNITVRKTASADVEEGSLGATVDLSVAHPFDYDGLTLVTGAQGAFNDLSDKVNPRGTFLVSNTFADGKFGALLSAAYTKRDLLDNGTRTVQWQNDGTVLNSAGAVTTAPQVTQQMGLDPTYTGSASLTQINQAFRPRIPAYEGFSTEQERMGFTTSFQFKPTDHTLLTLDGLYAKLDVIRQEAQLEAPGFSTAGATGTQAIDVVNATVVNNGVNGLGNQTSTLVAGTFNDVDIRSEARYDDLSTQFTQFSLNGDHSFTDTLKFHAMVGRARSNHDNPISTTLIMDAQDVDGYSYNYQNDSRLPTISYGNANVTAANTWTLAQIRINSVQVDNTVNNGLADLEWQFTDMLSVKGGLQYKEYENSVVTTNRVAAAGGTGNQQSVFPAGTVRTVDGYSKLYTLDGVTTNGSPATWLIPDVQKAYSVLGLGNQAVFPTGIASTLANNYTVDEKDKGVFAQLNFQMEVMGLPVRGNVGVRYVQTDQNSTGYTFANGAPVLNSADSDYSDTLPSLNVATNVTEDFIVRASAAKTVARNSLNFIVPRAAANVSGNAKTLNIGNPNLDPQRANVFDLGFEWYYQPEALLGVALFYKDIGTYVQNISTTGNFAANPLGLPNSVAIQACGPNVDPTACLGGWQFTVPTNTPGGNLKGAELSFQQPFTFLPAPFSNFGALVNYTYVDSQIQYLTIVNGATVVAATQDLISLSKNAANGTLYYDDGTFGARVSVAYRDQFYTTVPGRNLNDFEGTLGTTNIDASSSYKLNDNLTFTFEALNLTDEYSDQYIDTAGNRSVAYHHTGREFLMGARYRF